jgi:hypothetical protein
MLIWETKIFIVASIPMPPNHPRTFPAPARNKIMPTVNRSSSKEMLSSVVFVSVAVSAVTSYLDCFQGDDRTVIKFTISPFRAVLFAKT